MLKNVNLSRYSTVYGVRYSTNLRGQSSGKRRRYNHILVAVTYT